jgi:regulatory protein
MYVPDREPRDTDQGPEAQAGADVSDWEAWIAARDVDRGLETQARVDVGVSGRGSLSASRDAEGGEAERNGNARSGRRGQRGGPWNSNSGSEASERRRVQSASQDPEARARGLLLDSLSRSARTRGQLAEMLARKEVPEEFAEAALDRFTELGLVDDAAYAEAFTRSRHEHKGLGSRAIAFELRRRSVPDEVVQEAVAALDSDQEEQMAFRLARERQARMRGLPREVQSRRLAGFLARKGYGGELVGRAVREALANAAAEAEQDAFDPENLAFPED